MGINLPRFYEATGKATGACMGCGEFRACRLFVSKKGGEYIFCPSCAERVNVSESGVSYSRLKGAGKAPDVPAPFR